METRILLGGGGSAEDERPVLQQFASWVGENGRVLYLPIAMPAAGLPQWEWIQSTLLPLGIKTIEMWTDLQQHEPAELARYTGIFVSGGNTYHLLNQLRSAGFVQALREYALDGGVLYGGSAGAIVIGRDIDTCAHMDENIAGIDDTTGLDLVDGHAIWCHYTSSDNQLIEAYIARMHLPIIALAETSGIWVRGPHEPISYGSPFVTFK